MGGYAKTRSSVAVGKIGGKTGRCQAHYLVVVLHLLIPLNMFMGVKQFCTPRSKEIFIILGNILQDTRMLDSDLTNRF